MTVSVGLTASTTFDNAGATTTLTLTGTTIAGSTLVIGIAWTPIHSSTVADPSIAGNSLTYNKRVTVSKAGANSEQLVIWDVVNCAAQTNLTVTFTHANTGDYGTAVIVEVKSVDAASFENQNSNSGTGTDPATSTNSASNSTTDGFAFAGVCVDSGTNPAITTDPPSGWTTVLAQKDGANHLPSEWNYKILTGAASNSTSWSTTSTGGDGAWCAAIVTYKATVTADSFLGQACL